MLFVHDAYVERMVSHRATSNNFAQQTQLVPGSVKVADLVICLLCRTIVFVMLKRKEDTSLVLMFYAGPQESTKPGVAHRF